LGGRKRILPLSEFLNRNKSSFANYRAFAGVSYPDKKWYNIKGRSGYVLILKLGVRTPDLLCILKFPLPQAIKMKGGV
jgi:hypothetical protein